MGKPAPLDVRGIRMNLRNRRKITMAVGHVSAKFVGLVARLNANLSDEEAGLIR